MTKLPAGRPQDTPSASKRPNDVQPATDVLGSAGNESTLRLLAEDVAVTTRKVVTATVRVQTHTRTRTQVIDQPLVRDEVEITRVPVGRYVDAIPPIREDGDVTIMPVVEEVVVVERRLLLREEVHVRRIQTTERHTETVQLRDQDVTVVRTPAPPLSPSGEGSPPSFKPGETNA